jgi:hypothetical protein
VFASSTAAQTSASSTVARDVAALMTERQLEAFAVQDSEVANRFVASLLIPGVQMLVVSAEYPAPEELKAQLAQKNYRDVYVALHQPVSAPTLRARALSELPVLSGNLPDEVAWHVEAAGLFRTAGDPARALDHFHRALRLDSTSRPALAGAGEAAFELGDYVAARRFLRAARLEPSNLDFDRLSEMLEVADLVLERDPLRPRLLLLERRERLTADVAHVKERLDNCLTGGMSLTQPTRSHLDSVRADLDAWEVQGRRARDRSLERIEAGLSLVHRSLPSGMRSIGRRLFCRGLLGLRRAFQALPRRSRFLQPALGGLFIGVVLMVVPQVLGVGYDYVDQALNGGLVLRTMVLLCLVKLIATIVSYASGNAGGIFVPSLYLGAMAGGALGTIVHGLAPFPTAEPGAYALVGMGTLFAGIIRAPMTSVFMIFEITQDYQILVPLMVANLFSFLISRRFQPIPVYHALLQQDQIHLPSPATRPISAQWTAADVMTADVNLVSEGQPVRALWERSQENGAAVHLIGTADRLIGIVKVEELAKAIMAGHATDPVSLLVEETIVHAHPDHPSDVVLERLAQAGGVLPIVRREQAQQVVGVVTLAHVMRFMRHRGTAAERP